MRSVLPRSPSPSPVTPVSPVEVHGGTLPMAQEDEAAARHRGGRALDAGTSTEMETERATV
jgi:hypothetical protein